MEELIDSRNSAVIDTRFAQVLARSPSMIFRFPPEQINDIGSSLVRRLFVAARKLQVDDQPITVASMAAVSGIEIGTIDGWSIECPPAAIHEWEGILPLLRMHGLKRQLEVSLGSLAARIATADVMSIDDEYNRVVREIAQLSRGLDDLGPIDIGEILVATEKEMDEAREKGESAIVRIPTGVNFLDFLTFGGIALHRYWAFIGKFKNGKTIVLRNILMGMASNGWRVDHLAHDGGERRDHMFVYWSMVACSMALHRNVDGARIPLTGMMRTADGRAYADQAIITPDRLQLILAKEDPRITIPSDTMECIEDAKQHLINLSKGDGENGWLHVFDATQIRGDTNRMVRYLSDELAKGMHIFALDHVGVMGDADNEDYKNLTQTSKAIRKFISENPVAGIVLSQMTVRGQGYAGKRSVDQARGGDAILQDCDMACLIQKVDEDNDGSPFKFTAERSRWTRGGANTSCWFLTNHIASGLVRESLADPKKE